MACPYGCVCKAFGYIGAAATLWFLVRVWNWIQLNFLASTNIKKKYAKAGDWAVVTGAGDGIGKAMSLELGKRGMNVVLIGRTKSKLEDVAAEIKTTTKVIQFDFASDDYKKLFIQLDGISVGVLVNNVGIGNEMPEFLEDGDEEYNLKMVKVNIESQMRMTNYYLPKMKAKKSGAILSMSSISAVVPVPMLATYGATKAFNRQYSEAIAVEAKKSGVDVLAVTAHLVCSNMSKRRRATFDCVDANQMAKQSLNKLGNTAVSAGHWHHSLIISVLNSLPASFVANKLLGMHIALRKVCIRKKEREAAEGKK